MRGAAVLTDSSVASSLQATPFTMVLHIQSFDTLLKYVYCWYAWGRACSCLWLKDQIFRSSVAEDFSLINKQQQCNNTCSILQSQRILKNPHPLILNQASDVFWTSYDYIQGIYFETKEMLQQRTTVDCSV